RSTGTGILPARLENGITGEVFAQTTLSSTSEPETEHGRAVTWTRERTVGGMSKNRIKPTQGAASSEEKGQPLDLVTLYEKHKRPIHTYVYRLLGSQEDADDVTQEVFVRAFVSWNELYDHDNLSPWLYRIATNLCVDLLRRRKRISWWPLVRRSPGSQFERSTEEEASYLPLDTGGIPEVFERDLIRLALAKLPEDYAVVLVLNAAQGLSYQDIATIVGISPNAAATRISRAKRMFAEQYQRLNEDETNQREDRK
ncbi:MAG TPA: RNA polymerase sigma factor, partial [Ktedonobacteraceae bacterium]